MRSLAVLLIVGVTSFSGCLQTYNSSYSDRTLYGRGNFDNSTPEGQRFAAAYEILRTYCVRCHSLWFNQTTEEGWKSLTGAGGRRLVVAGDLVNSYLYAKMVGSGVGGPENMPPPTDPQHSPSDLDVVREWIEQMQ